MEGYFFGFLKVGVNSTSIMVWSSFIFIIIIINKWKVGRLEGVLIVLEKVCWLVGKSQQANIVLGIEFLDLPTFQPSKPPVFYVFLLYNGGILRQKERLYPVVKYLCR